MVRSGGLEVPRSGVAIRGLEVVKKLTVNSHPTRTSKRIKEKKERLASATDLSAEQEYKNFLADLAAHKPAVE